MVEKIILNAVGFAGVPRTRYQERVKSFRHILITAVVVAAIFPTCMAAIPLLLKLRTEIKRGAERELKLTAERIASEVQHELWLITQRTLDLSKDSGLQNLPTDSLTSENVQTLLRDYVAANPPIAAIFILSATGARLNAWPNTLGTSAIRPTWKNWLDQVDRRNGKLNRTNIQVLAENDSHYLAEIANQVGNSRGNLRSSRFFTLFFPMTSHDKNKVRSVLVALLPLENVARCHQWRAPSGGWVDFLDGTQNFMERLPGDRSQATASQLFATAPLEITHGALGKNIFLTVQVSEPANVELIALRRELLPILVGLASALMLVALFAFFSSRQLALPIQQLVRHARAIAAGYYQHPPPKLKFLELAELAATLGDLGTRVAAEITYRIEQERQKSEIERTRVESALHSMLQQMQPHFLFNCLNNISSEIPTAPERATEMIQRLSDLYRFILEATKQTTSEFARELDIVKEYLELQKMRYGDRLHYRFEIPHPSPNFLMPSLLLQTLTENAVKHGIAKTRAGGWVILKVTEPNSGRFEIDIINSGAPLKVGSSGTGLENSRRRLDLLYGNTHQFSIRTNETGQTVVHFSLPGGST